MSIRQGDRILANKTVPSVYTAGPGISIDNGVISTIAKYTYRNTSPQSTEWVIEHNLNGYPSVTVVDSEGDVVECCVHYQNPNVCIVKMNTGCAGVAYLN